MEGGREGGEGGEGEREGGGRYIMDLLMNPVPQAMFLNVLFKSLRSDPELNRVKVRGEIIVCSCVRMHLK